MSAHRKPGPAVLDGGRRYEPKHRDSASDRQHEWALPMRLMDDFIQGFSRSARDFQAPTTVGGS